MDITAATETLHPEPPPEFVVAAPPVKAAPEASPVKSAPAGWIDVKAKSEMLEEASKMLSPQTEIPG